MAVVLALDLASASGAAWDGPDGKPLFETFRLPPYYGPAELGARSKKFVIWLHGLMERVKPAVVAIEAPLVPTKHGNLKTTAETVRLLISLVAMAHYVAECNDARVIEKNVQTVKRHWTGTGAADKHMMMQRCRQMGYPIHNDHEADAAGLWSLVKSEICPGFSYQTSPLFGRGGKVAGA
jgi:Holliday junction resolvasome RuvABC endonuclease subunit